jgi:hypothetical protein
VANSGKSKLPGTKNTASNKGWCEMPTAYDRAQDRYYHQNWNAQEQQARDTLTNNAQILDANVWNNAAATGNTRGSYNQYAYNQQYQPLQQNLNATVGQINRDRTLYTAQVGARNAAEAAARKAREEAEKKAAMIKNQMEIDEAIVKANKPSDPTGYALPGDYNVAVDKYNNAAFRLTYPSVYSLMDWS